MGVGGRGALSYCGRQNSKSARRRREPQMAELTVSSEGRIRLPADLRRRLGMGAGAKLELIEEPDGVKLRVARRVDPCDLAALAGMAKAPSRGMPRSLVNFDPASVSSRSARARD